MRTIEPIVRMDLAFSLFCLQHRFNTPVAKISRWVSKTGDGHLYLMLGLVIWYMDDVVGRFFFAAALLAFAIELPIYWLTKTASSAAAQKSSLTSCKLLLRLLTATACLRDILPLHF